MTCTCICLCFLCILFPYASTGVVKALHMLLLYPSLQFSYAFFSFELSSFINSIVAKCPGMAGTVPEFGPMSRQCPG